MKIEDHFMEKDLILLHERLQIRRIALDKTHSMISFNKQSHSITALRSCFCSPLFVFDSTDVLGISAGTLGSSTFSFAISASNWFK